MQLQTKVHIPPTNIQISHQHHIFCLGSCFATHMFDMFQKYWFHTKINPCGITYNPISMAKQIGWLLYEQDISDPVHVQEQWIPFDFHGSFRRESLEQTQKICKTHFDIYRSFFSQSTIDIYTFGTSFVYEYRGEIVNNCHKIPSKFFERERLLTIDEILDNWSPMLEDMQSKFPKKQIILTLSPVRHTRNGLVGNSVSKSIVRTCIHELTQFPNVHYFPSYEIMLDELRDYRFYKDDMLHPTNLTIAYMWNIFLTHYMTTETQNILAEIYKIEKMKDHRFMNASQEEKTQYLENIIKKESSLRKKYNIEP